MKKILLLTLSVVISFLFVACIGNNEVEDEVVPYPVSAGNVTVEQEPIRIASLSHNITDILIDLGYFSKIIGLPDGSGISTSVTGVEHHIGNAMEPNLEQIGILKPEIIFTATPLPKQQMDKFSEVGIKVVVLPVAKTVQELKNQYYIIIQILSGQVVANDIGFSILKDIEYDIEDIKSKIIEKKNILYVISMQPIIATGDTFEGNIISTVANNLADEFKSYSVDKEQLKKQNPDTILYAKGITPESISKSELFKDSNAVKNKSLIEIDQNKLLKHDKKFIQNLRDIASKIYPDIDFTRTPNIDVIESSDIESSK